MKILHIIPTYLPAIASRGVIDSMHFLNKQLVRKGADVFVYTTNLDGARGVLNVPIGREVSIDGVKVFYFEGSFPKRWYFSRGMIACLAKTAAEFDLIHITSVFLAESTIGSYYARKFKKPCVITPHGSLMRHPLSLKPLLKKAYIFFVEKHNLKKAILHFTTETEKEEFAESGLLCGGTAVIPNAFEPEKAVEAVSGEFRTKAGITQKAPLILFLGRLARIKGLDTLLPAFAEVLKQLPDATLVLAGPDDGGYVENIKTKISKLKIENKVIFAGTVAGAKKRNLFLDADIFVAPSYSENFGMAIVEAMYFGLPVVVAEGVGIASLIARAGAGIVVQKNEKELSAAILKLFSDRKTAEQMGLVGKRLVEEEFSSERVAERFFVEYNRAIVGLGKI